MIRACVDADFDQILAIINDAAEAYRGVIPDDCFHDPYMAAGELAEEIAAGIVFSAVEDGGILCAVMGIQDVDDVTLIRHAYVRTDQRRRGLGGELLRHLREHTDKPLLIGTWAAAEWAIDFYRKHGFDVVSEAETAALLQRYWTVPDRQIETSVVLAERDWLAAR